MRQLAASPGPAVALLRRHLRPAIALDEAVVDRLLRDLDAEAFATRDAATAELTKLADRLEPRLRSARVAASAEVQRRLDEILLKGSKPTADRLREGRALTVLEWIGMPEAVQLLATLAGGATDDPLTRGAAAGRDRLKP
jgi:hypothetical protein